jgi:CDP-glucose 4,6-dehydratase
MEGLVMVFDDIYRGKRVLVTGHCGFKGSWLVLWLKMLGAEVMGFGHPPNTVPNHHELLGNSSFSTIRQDLLEPGYLQTVMGPFKPDIVFHLAAKAIVARTFTEPKETFENNVMGAVNILEACRHNPSVKGIVMITTDKVYEDRNWQWGYRENDELGGVDPYSASKVCVEQVIRCYRRSFKMNIATARAGNVIGGGDWSYKRLLPDIVRAASKGETVVIHTPKATRPFQHVLDAAQGYLLLGKKILEGGDVNRAYNFGPSDALSVEEVLNVCQNVWPAVKWTVDETETHPFMVYLLKIDSTKARELGWKPIWGGSAATLTAIEWYRDYYENGEVNSKNDILAYERRMER